MIQRCKPFSGPRDVQKTTGCGVFQSQPHYFQLTAAGKPSWTASTLPGCRTSTKTWRASTTRERSNDGLLPTNNVKHQDNVVQYVTRKKRLSEQLVSLLKR